MMAKPGSIGYVVQYYFDDPIYIPMSRPQAFLVGPNYTDKDVAELYWRMKLYLAAKFRLTVTQQLAHLRDPVEGFDHEINRVHFDDFPTADQLEAIFDRELTGGAHNILDFNPPDGILRLFEAIVSVTRSDDEYEGYIGMFMDIFQVRFDE